MRCLMIIAAIVLMVGSAFADALPQKRGDEVGRADRSRRIDVVPDFCRAADVDGKTDNTACVQAASAAACAAQSGELHFPAGRYFLKAQVTVACDGQTWVGDGIGNRDTTASGSWLGFSRDCGSVGILWHKAGLAGNYAYGGGLRGFTLFNDVNGTACLNNLVQVDNVQSFTASSLYIFNGKLPFAINAGIQSKLSGIFMEALLPGGVGVSYYGTGVTANQAAQATRGDLHTIEDMVITMGSPVPQHGTCLAVHGFVATLILRSFQCLNPYNGIVIDCINGGAADIGACPAFYDFRDVEIDFADNINLFAEDFQYLKCFGCYFHAGATTVNNVLLRHNHFKTAYSAQFIGGKIDGAQGSCIKSSIQALVVTGVDIALCNRGNTGAAAVEIDADGSGIAGNNVIADNTLCMFAGVASEGPSMLGVLIGRGVGDSRIHDNATHGCAAGNVANNNGIQDNSGVKTNRIHDN